MAAPSYALRLRLVSVCPGRRGTLSAMTSLPSVDPQSYCAHAAGHPFHGPYHDEEYGFPLEEDDALFGRLLLEMNQAGLSWLTILKKKQNFEAAYAGFSVAKVAGVMPNPLIELEGGLLVKTQ